MLYGVIDDAVWEKVDMPWRQLGIRGVIVIVRSVGMKCVSQETIWRDIWKSSKGQEGRCGCVAVFGRFWNWESYMEFREFFGIRYIEEIQYHPMKNQRMKIIENRYYSKLNIDVEKSLFRICPFSFLILTESVIKIFIRIRFRQKTKSAS